MEKYNLLYVRVDWSQFNVSTTEDKLVDCINWYIDNTNFVLKSIERLG